MVFFEGGWLGFKYVVFDFFVCFLGDGGVICERIWFVCGVNVCVFGMEIGNNVVELVFVGLFW